MTKLSMAEAANLFLDTWYKISPQTYNELWYPGAIGTHLVDDCAKMYPKLYKKILDTMEQSGADF